MIDFEVRPGLTIQCTPESQFGFEFFTFRSPQMVVEMDRFIELAKGKKCFWDIGASHGIFSLVFRALNPDSQIIAFEPSEEPRLILNENCASKNITVSNAALSDAYGDAEAHMEWDMVVLGPTNDQWPVSASAPCVIGDDHCRLMNHEPDLLKIDVEGHEIHVLKGLSETIRKHYPPILLEAHVGKLGDQYKEMLDFLVEWGYEIIGNDGTQEDQRLICK